MGRINKIKSAIRLKASHGKLTSGLFVTAAERTRGKENLRNKSSRLKGNESTKNPYGS